MQNKIVGDAGSAGVLKSPSKGWTYSYLFTEVEQAPRWVPRREPRPAVVPGLSRMWRPSSTTSSPRVATICIRGQHPLLMPEAQQDPAAVGQVPQILACVPAFA